MQYPLAQQRKSCPPVHLPQHNQHDKLVIKGYSLVQPNLGG